MILKPKCTAWWIAAGLVVAGCNNGTSGMDATSEGGTDASHVVDVVDATAPTDTGLDVPSSEIAVTDTSPPDAVTDTSPPDAVDVVTADVPVATGPCAPAALLNLNTAGTLTGSTVDYRGDLSTAPAAAPTGFAPSCQSNVGHVVAFAYTLRTTSRLLISTFHNDGASLDTVVVAQTACVFAGATELGCDDDVPSLDQDRSPAPNNTSQSIFTTSSGTGNGTTPAGTTVYIFVAGYNTNAGTYHLSVTEIAPPSASGGPCELAASPGVCGTGLGCIASGTDNSTFTCTTAVATGGACDTNRIMNVCGDGSSCIGTPSVCEVDGASGGNCRTSGTPCDAGLGCNSNSQCVTAVAIGAVCDTSGSTNVCVPGSSCQMGATTATCIADGTLGGGCTSAAPGCNSGLVCGVNGLCVTGVALGGTCDPSGAANACFTGSSCVMGSTTATCIADGSLGGICRSTGSPCDTGLACATSSSTCIPLIAAGGTCDPLFTANLCAPGSVCMTVGSASTCVAHTYVASASAAAWIDACATTGHTEVLMGADDDAVAVTLPFAFTFYGTVFSSGATATMSSNGWFSPVASVTDSNNVLNAFPQSPDNAIYAVFADLIFADSTGATTPRACLATTGTAPARTFTLEWFHDEFYGTPADDHVTMEIQLHEGTSNFDLLYNEYVGNAVSQTPAAGVESAGGTSSTVLCQGADASACSTTTAVNTRFTASP